MEQISSAFKERIYEVKILRDYIIFSDATCDLPGYILDDMGIEVIPMEFEIEGKTYKDHPKGGDIGFHEMYDMLRSGKTAVTTQINYDTYRSFFEPKLKQGFDIIYIGFSSGLSGTFSTACIVGEDLKEEYPDAGIFMVDSLAASVGEGQLVYNAALKKQAGMTVDDLYQWVKDNRDHFCHWFTVDDLNHLRRGGRCSAAAAIVGTALGIKPVLHVDNEGHLIPMLKVRGRRKSLEAMLDKMKETCIKPEEQVIFIGHGDSIDEAQELERMVREALPVKDVIINRIGPTIGAHSGPGTIALFFYGTQK